MTKIVEQTSTRLVIENKPRAVFAFILALGLIALLASLYSLAFGGKAFSKDAAFGLALGPAFIIGGLLLYRETITELDKSTGMATWRRSGLWTNASDRARLNRIVDAVIGKPTSQQSGGATRLVLVLEDRFWPLAFGFSAVNRDKEIRSAVLAFLDESPPETSIRPGGKDRLKGSNF